MSNCPHCSAAVDPQVSYCPTCGKAVAAGSGPRIVEGKALAATSTGLALQTEELQKQSRRAFGSLLLIAIVQFVAAGVLLALAEGGGGRLRQGVQATAVVVGIVGLVFLGLAFWARRSPYPAGLTGLVLLLTLWTVDAVVDPRSLATGLLVKVIILFALFRAVQAGTLHRRLLREAEARSA